MNIFMVSFTLEDDVIGGRSHSARWTDLYECIRVMSARWWKDTSSFIIFETEHDISQICYHIKGSIALGYDIVLVMSPDGRTSRLIGHTDDKDIFEMLPYLKEE